MIFVDTNYFLRFLIKDNDSQFEETRSFFEEGSKGKIKLFTSVVVFFEIYWVLSSFYEKDKKEVAEILKNILELVFIDFENKEILDKSVDYYRKKNLDLEDAYNIAYFRKMKGQSFKTFDIKLKKYISE